MDTTNISQSEIDSAQRHADPSNIVSEIENAATKISKTVTSFFPGFGRVKPSSEPVIRAPAPVSFESDKSNTRVMLMVPSSYLDPLSDIAKNGGILFPYTPSFDHEYIANYNEMQVTHSNFKQIFYKNSTVSDITLNAKFTVQNTNEVGIYLSTVHLLRSLTKMKWGDDPNAGAPPPVCRLMAYGNFMFDNTPVAIRSFKINLPDNVDYIDSSHSSFALYGAASVPVISTFTITLIPIYSRNEQQKFTVSNWLKTGRNSASAGTGYL